MFCIFFEGVESSFFFALLAGKSEALSQKIKLSLFLSLSAAAAKDAQLRELVQSVG